MALAPESLERLERALAEALASGDESALAVLGYGEISCVVAWPQSQAEDAPRLACKRLPDFESAASLDGYARCFADYLARLEAGGVTPVASHLQRLARPGGAVAGWCVQPLLPAGSLLPDLLRARAPDGADALIDELVARVHGLVGPRVGLDGQLSNWAQVDGALRYLDVTTPMLRDAQGREQLDTELFLASLPWALRGLVRRLMLGAILDKYYEPRGVLLDLLGNLYKERLDHLLPVWLPRVNATLERAIKPEEVRAYYREDARMWALLQRLRRADRWWQRRVRRRVYPFLLPRTIAR
ncbi:MAG: hypothetical protein H6713_27720 [Myxococcales bacterium]|nr:hypothetical protein [Myxococcales bacterium]